MHLIALYVTGNDEYSRMLRRALMRYLNLSLILVLRSISSAVKKRFPTLDHVVDSGKLFMSDRRTRNGPFPLPRLEKFFSNMNLLILTHSTRSSRTRTLRLLTLKNVRVTEQELRLIDGGDDKTKLSAVRLENIVI